MRRGAVILGGRASGSATEILRVFLRLGVSCFGGPIAHLGYFRAEFVERRRWVDERAFADLVALAQFLPGPASSQTGFAIGLMRGGYLGGIAAWFGFTLPSAVLMTAFAYGAGGLAETRLGTGVLHGLRLVAVAIVAQAVWGMARTLAPDRERASVATAVALLALLAPTAPAQLGAIVFGALAGLALCSGKPSDAAAPEPARLPLGARAGVAFLALFAALLVLPPLLRGTGGWSAVFGAFYRSGALVFGGGHVVLPLLHDAVVAPGWVSDAAFLAGYGAAQALPGPLFTFAAYLGAVIQRGPGGVAGAALALVAIFLPGILLLLGTLPFWDALRRRPRAQAAMHGVNAAVVGLLAAALYTPVWTSSVRRPADFALALVGFVLLTVWRVAPLVVVLIGALGGAVMALAGSLPSP